ncbi:MAG TPA: helix-hairpin-helix domain-containing protein [Desulfuromonadales bacterium]|nr:helix-hairpin-helix domain-containing protein [Desulfuromonadales bacterium]
MTLQRIVLLFFALLVAVPVIVKSRSNGIEPVSAAFSVMTSSSVVRVSGDVRHAGIYRIVANEMPHSVINMALPGRVINRYQSEAIMTRRLQNGDDLRVRLGSDGTAFISYSTLSARQRMLLGIPLDINVMSESDFDALPGIGPVMARRIVEYRQNNGGKMRVSDLKKVDGIGEKIYGRLYNMFQLP